MKIALLGDIALFGRLSVNKNPNVEDYFSEIADYLSVFDYVVGNLETPFSIAKKTKGAKSAYIFSDVDNVRLLKQLHVKAVCLANNHMFDFGQEGYEITKEILASNNIDYFGTEGKELHIDEDGNMLALTGFCCYSSNPLNCVKNGGYGVNAYNVLEVKDVLYKNNQQGYLNIVAVHAGIEHVNYPSLDHIRVARQFADITPYVYYGHHPHVIQGMENYKGSIIAHSLGNFCFDDVYSSASSTKPLITLTENNRYGIILELTIEHNQIKESREQLIYISKDGKLELVDNLSALGDYNDALIQCECDPDRYNTIRNEIIFKRIIERKRMRNIQWYLKRLRPKYVRLMLDGRKNKRLYEENVKKYL